MQKALGKGLAALIPEKSSMEDKQDIVRFVKIAEIQENTLQPRTDYDEEKLSELIASIKEKGVLQPILVRENGSGGFEVIAGERRLRAARALNLEQIPVIIKKVSDHEALVLALVENIQRQELNPIEEAQAFKKLIEDFQFTQDAVAQSVGKNRSTITNVLRLLKLPEEIQKSIFEGVLSEGHARALLGVENLAEQRDLFAHAIARGLSVRELEHLVRTGFKAAPHRKTARVQRDYNVVVLEEELQKALGTKVRILAKKKRGKIVIEYYSNEDLDRIMNLIKR